MANNTKPILTGKEVAHRAEDFDFSPRQRDFIHKTETVTYKMKVGKTFEIGNPEVTSDDARHLTSDLVMPGSLADIMASFKIPGNWSGQKKLRLRVVRESVDSNWLRTMANAAGLASNADDGSEPVLLEYVLDRERNVMVLQRPAVSNAAVDNAIESGVFANEVEAGDPVDLMVHVQDIDVDHRVYAGWDGQDWLSFSVKNHAVTGDQLKLTCAVYVDDAEEPYYLNLPYYKQATSTRRTQTFRVPLSALVDDVNLHQRARVVISAVGTEESAWINNEFTVNLAGANPLRFVRQPEDVVVQEGEDVAFTVEVTGGVKPYACQWQVWDPKHEKWVDLPGFTDPTLSRKDIEKKWDGARFRCVVTDAEGTQIISREVTLTVRKGVDTGDNSNLPLYLAVALGALALLWFMRRRSLRG
jgi:MYXO-CTERM domain-containing protein